MGSHPAERRPTDAGESVDSVIGPRAHASRTQAHGSAVGSVGRSRVACTRRLKYGTRGSDRSHPRGVVWSQVRVFKRLAVDPSHTVMVSDVSAPRVHFVIGDESCRPVAFGPYPPAIDRLPHAILQASDHGWDLIGPMSDVYVRMPRPNACVQQQVVELVTGLTQRFERMRLFTFRKYDRLARHDRACMCEQSRRRRENTPILHVAPQVARKPTAVGSRGDESRNGTRHSDHPTE